jgi:hypothetical protein
MIFLYDFFEGFYDLFVHDEFIINDEYLKINLCWEEGFAIRWKVLESFLILLWIRILSIYGREIFAYMGMV